MELVEPWKAFIWSWSVEVPIVMSAATGKMCFKKYYVLLFFSLLVHSHYALNCHEGSGKDMDFKSIYRTCLKRQEGKNSSQSRGSSDDDWRDSRGHRPKSSWDRDSKLGRDDKYRDDRNRDEGMYRDDMYGSERTSNDRTGSSYDRMGTSSNYDRSGSNYDRMGGSYDRIGSSYDRMGGNYDRMGSSNRDAREERLSRSDVMGRRDMMERNNENSYGRSQISSRDDFGQGEEFGVGEMTSYNNYRSSTQSSRRFKREKRMGTNSGQRSQYNPNVSNRPSYDDYRNEDRNMNHSSNSSKNDYTACAMHCFLENLEMTGDNGMPDRYLVTHAITKDVKNEDLRDFLQESIEECFQILDNEHTDDKCEFSKNLLMCLAEKGRANCDDWKDDMQF